MLPTLLVLASCTGGGAVDQIFGDSTASACDQPENLVENCGFDTDLSGWELRLTGIDIHVADDGSSKLGSLEVVGEMTSPNHYYGRIHQCITVTPSTTYSFGVDVRVAEGAPNGCAIGVQRYTTPDCSGSHGGDIFGGTLELTELWTQSSRFSVTAVTGGGSVTRTVQLSVNCSSDTVFAVRFDDFVLSEAS